MAGLLFGLPRNNARIDDGFIPAVAGARRLQGQQLVAVVARGCRVPGEEVRNISQVWPKVRKIQIAEWVLASAVALLERDDFNLRIVLPL
jgi:hypothetical protein